MRLRDPRTLHLALLYVLPVVVGAAGWGVAGAVTAALGAALAGAALRLVLAMRAARQTTHTLRLHTVTHSTYSEKVRWCLDRLGVPYEERPDAGVLGVLLTGRTVPTLEIVPGRTRIDESSRILRYLWGEHAGRLPGERTWFLEPTPATLDLEARFDRGVGRDARVWAYEHILRDRALLLRLWGMEEPDVPAWQRALLAATMPLLRFAVRRLLGVTPERARRALQRTHAAFEEVDRLLADGRPYLTGETLTFADVTFAALAAPAVLPPEYPGGRVRGQRLRLEDVADPAWRVEIAGLREHPAGRFILRLYREARSARP